MYNDFTKFNSKRIGIFRNESTSFSRSRSKNKRRIKEERSMRVRGGGLMRIVKVNSDFYERARAAWMLHSSARKTVGEWVSLMGADICAWYLRQSLNGPWISSLPFSSSSHSSSSLYPRIFIIREPRDSTTMKL